MWVTALQATEQSMMSERASAGSGERNSAASFVCVALGHSLTSRTHADGRRGLPNECCIFGNSETRKLGNWKLGNSETRKLGNSKLETRSCERFCTGRRQFRVFCLIRLSVKTGGRLLDSKAVGSHSSHCHSHPPPLIIHLRDWSHPCVAVNHDDVMEREIRQGERTPPAQKEQLAVYHSKFLYHSMNPAMLQSDEASTGK